ncbi:MAG: formyl-CoA transferase [Anaerolineaceae bacterium]|nr:formyl-CoA transferase [Anaerolineaceae bacterium]
MSVANNLLKNICVVDLTRVLAGPYCTMMLGDLGADVIKIEVPGRGDDTRHWGPPFTEGGESAYYLSANRNKRSLTLNLKSAQGLEILKKLIAKGDVLVDNFKTGTLSRWGLDYETLQEIRPGLIYCTVTGYGYTGPYSSRPGYDLIVQATGGFMSITGPENGDPSRAGVAIADISTGMFASNAILAALYSREKTGEGQRIDMSLLDSQVALLSYAATNYFVSGSITNRLGNAHPNIVPYQSFKAQDMHFVLAVGNDKQWEIFCKSINKPEWIDDEKYSTNALRVNNRRQLIDQLNKLFATQNAGYWLEIFDKVGLPSGPINELDKVFENEQIKSREMQIELPHSIDNKVTLLNSPIKIPTSPTKTHKAPPTLGEHTEEILKEKIGLDQDAVAKLRDEGIL